MNEEIYRFREALDKIDWSEMPIGFHNFPRGTCGDISDILAEHLYFIGVTDIVYVCGKRNGGTHAWLEISGLAVDVTADQFDDVVESVLIQSPTIWHNKFSEITRRKAGYKHIHGLAIPNLMRVHNEISKKMRGA